MGLTRGVPKPSWAKDPSVGSRMFNARIEEAAEKSSFRNSVAKRRAVIPATGYYEWRLGSDGVKHPQFIHSADGRPLLLAGLYEWWRNPAAAEDAADKWLLSATILTTDSAGALASIHDRMPVVLDHGFLDEWLDPYQVGDGELLAAVAESAKTGVDELTHYEVDRAVGSVKNNGPQLIEPVPESAPRRCQSRRVDPDPCGACHTGRMRRKGPVGDSLGRTPRQILHRAARIEDAVHEFRARRRPRRPVTTVVPYTGYGAPGWARVMCRVLLTRADRDADRRPQKVRGWRSFATLPAKDVPVTVEAGDVDARGARRPQRPRRHRGQGRPHPGLGRIRLSTPDAEPVEAPIRVIDPAVRFGIISDIDDTVMVTALPRPLLAALEHLRPRRARPRGRARHGGALRAAGQRPPRRTGASTCPPAPGTSRRR